MKKFLFLFVAMMSIVLSAHAQKAIETASFFDNTYVGASIGATTPLSFNSVFPVNGNLSIRAGKNLTPVVGLFLEGTAMTGDNVGFAHQPCFSNTFIKQSNVGLNMTLNLTNIFNEYTGVPRKVELATVTGIGWNHFFSNGLSHQDDLTAKTGVDIFFNLGKQNKWQLFVEPAVNWNLTAFNTRPKFNKSAAHLGLSLGVVYKFKTSKVWNVGELNEQIKDLLRENEILRNQPPKEVRIETIKEVKTFTNSTVVVPFEFDSSELTAAAKQILETIPVDSKVGIIGTASPEGSSDHNSKLSKARGQAVADFLIHRGVEVTTVKGDEAGRLAIITVQ